MGATPPKPLGADGYHPEIDSGTMSLQRSPAPRSAGSPAGHGTRVLRTLVFDAESLDRLFRSAAYSIALAGHLKVVPMRAEKDDALGVKAIIALTPDSSLPQTVEPPDADVLAEQAKAGANEFGELFSEQLDTRGIAGAIAFLEDVEAQRENALSKVQEIYHSTSRHNADAIETAEHIKTSLAVVKCASTITLAFVTLPVVAGVSGVAGAFAVSTTYSIGLSVIKNWDHASSADLVLISTEKAATKVEQKVVKDTSKHVAAALESEAQDLSSANRKIEWLSKRLAGGVGRARGLRRLTRAEEAARTARNAGRWATGLKKVPYLFFLWSAKDAIDTLHEDLHSH